MGEGGGRNILVLGLIWALPLHIRGWDNGDLRGMLLCHSSNRDEGVEE